jgi:hypothetical protein
MRRLVPLLLLPLVGCASMTPADFAKNQPQMQLEEYFKGDSTAYGMFLDRGENVKRQFKVAMHGAFDGSVLKLDEDFTYDDGERQQRHWTFRKVDDHDWIGTAPDVIGEAHGHWQGNAYEMNYTADLKAGSSTYRLNFDDWLFRQSDNVVLNHTEVTKFGVDVGEVQLVFIR